MGGPRLGKSTFGRLLVNTLLNTHPCVAYLDTDPGQPELTVPGVPQDFALLTKAMRQFAFSPPHAA